jgi:hypothetical protein
VVERTNFALQEKKQGYEEFFGNIPFLESIRKQKHRKSKDYAEQKNDQPKSHGQSLPKRGTVLPRDLSASGSANAERAVTFTN